MTNPVERYIEDDSSSTDSFLASGPCCLTTQGLFVSLNARNRGWGGNGSDGLFWRPNFFSHTERVTFSAGVVHNQLGKQSQGNGLGS